MWGLLLLLVVAAGLSNVAGGLQGQGMVWAYRLCTAAAGLCDHPDWVAVTAGSTALAFLAVRLIRAC